MRGCTERPVGGVHWNRKQFDFHSEADMGCDIHAFIEFKQGDHWVPFGGELNITRNYELFGAMAGVRCDGAVVPPRGIPDDIAYTASGAWWLYVSDSGSEGTASFETAKRYQQMGSRVKESGGKLAWVENPDWHTPSWLTTAEFKQALEKVEGRVGVVANATLAAMVHLESRSDAVRIVFWFDN